MNYCLKCGNPYLPTSNSDDICETCLQKNRLEHQERMNKISKKLDIIRAAKRFAEDTHNDY